MRVLKGFEGDFLSFNKLFEKAINSLGLIVYNERTIDLFAGHKKIIRDMVEKYANEKEFNFVGQPTMARSVRDFSIDVPSYQIWRLSNSGWKFTPTGLGTEDNVWPLTNYSIHWNKDPDHQAYLASILELGSANNMFRFHFADINGVPSSGRFMVWPQARLPSLKIYQLHPPIKILENGQIRLKGEFDGTAPTEIVPGGSLHLFPFEILQSTNVGVYVSATTTPPS